MFILLFFLFSNVALLLVEASCDSEAECRKCVTVPGCVFVKYKEFSEICQDLIEVTTDPVEPKIFNSTGACPEAGDGRTMPIPTTSTSTIGGKCNVI